MGWLDNGCTGVLIAPDVIIFAAHCGVTVSTVWFGDSLEIAVDDDSGTARADDAPGVTQVTVARCEAFPNAQLAAGTDVAFCILTHSATATMVVVPPLMGCLHDAIAVGAVVTLVGFGRSSPGDPPGKKRAAQMPIQDVGVEIAIGDHDHGSCTGDSGSPAFVGLGEATGSDWHLAGILSTGLEGDGCGVGFYEDLTPLVPWLEEASGRDITPCFTSAGMLADASCRTSTLDSNGLPSSTAAVAHYYCSSGIVESSHERPASCATSQGRADHNLPALVLAFGVAMCVLVKRTGRG